MSTSQNNPVSADGTRAKPATDADQTDSQS